MEKRAASDHRQNKAKQSQLVAAKTLANSEQSQFQTRKKLNGAKNRTLQDLRLPACAIT
ncbi:MAG: hypothetical protein JXN61_03600 [Sedimentisphaerales bacterium]|nr:hypothetical protein [Sedimentisphaerales bacterium]